MDNTSYTTSILGDSSLWEALDAIGEAGFPQAEVNGSEPHVVGPPTGGELSRFRDRLEAHPVRARTMHARGALGSPVEAERRESVAGLGRSLRFAGAIGLTETVIHPVPNPDKVSGADDPGTPQRVRDAVVRSLDDLVPIAASAGVRITLENLPYQCNFPFLTMESLRPLVDQYPKESLGLVIDTGHVGVRRMDPVSELHAAGDRLYGTHLHDMDFSVHDGDHRPPGRDGLDWGAIRRTFDEIGYTGPWTFEVLVPRQTETPEELLRLTRAAAVEWGMAGDR